ncbi:hypothetical protein AYO46_01030 [Betaproteobacteria bacterium SCGC AG-212-J23]|nr:hypothetical protein AYO46_01030 [Betaproteobacteria bacterium SCGC AG-212-J23]
MRAIALFRGLVILVAAAAALALLASGPGYRLGAWHFRVGISLVRWSGYLGIAGAVLALVALVVPRLRAGAARSLAAALVVAGTVGGITGYWASRAASLPRIHDITTDTENPPQLVAALPLRAGAENTAVYGGPKLAAEQKQGYPDLAPLSLPLAPAAVFERARMAAAEMGWQIVAADPAGGRIEATDTTAWFGFHDDIVVRVVAAGSGSRVDVRSVSRVGRSDIGTNAKRIRGFLARLSAA